MSIYRVAPFRGVSAAGVRAEAAPVELVNKINSAFEEFKQANDERLKALEKGKADPVLEGKVDAINAEISKLQGQLADLAAQAASAGRLGSGDSAAEMKAVQAFARIVGSEVTPEVYAEYARAINVYMRRGAATPQQVMAALSVGSAPDGGFTVTSDMSGRIVSRLFETSPMRQVANVVTIGTDALEGFNDLDEAGAGWVAERGTRAETDTPELGKWQIPVHELYAEPKATQKVLDDSMFDIEAWLAGKVADKFIRTENAGFVVGDGAGKPRGLFTYTTTATADASRAWGQFEHINTGASGAFAAAPAGGDTLVDTVFKLKAGHRTNASWMMARATLAAVRKLKDGDGNYLWQPNFEARQGGLLLGFPVVEAEDAPALGANSLSIAFGDFREAYTIVDRAGITVLRDPYTQKGFVKFYTVKRTGGGAINFDAVKFVRFGS
jgi:HK97 family phage major capsid protein